MMRSSELLNISTSDSDRDIDIEIDIENDNFSNFDRIMYFTVIEIQKDSIITHSNSSDFDISNMKGLKISNLNVNSLIKHIDEIRILLAENKV